MAGTVLIAEDHELVRNLFSRTLERHGFKTLLAADGEEAVEQFKRYQAEVELLPDAMDELDGRMTPLPVERGSVVVSAYENETANQPDHLGQVAVRHWRKGHRNAAGCLNRLHVRALDQDLAGSLCLNVAVECD